MKVLKWIGIILGSLIVLVVIVVLVIVLIANGKLHKTYDITPEAITLPTDSASLARGAHLVNVLCTDCHAGGLEGKLFFDQMPLATVYTSNLTSGKGGVGAKYTDADWVRSIRHGVNPEGKSLFIMPAHEFHNMSEHDLGSVIAYLKTIQPIDKERKENKYGLMGKILLATGAFGKGIIPAHIINHEEGFKEAPPEGVTPEYGGYLVAVTGCKGCHQDNLGGGKVPDPNSPPALNITKGGNLGEWSAEDFITAMRTGKTPEGIELRDEYMPWPNVGRYTDAELSAIFAYLQSVPAVESEEE